MRLIYDMLCDLYVGDDNDDVVHFNRNVVIPEGISVSMWLMRVTKVGRVDDWLCLLLSRAFVCHASFCVMWR